MAFRPILRHVSNLQRLITTKIAMLTRMKRAAVPAATAAFAAALTLYPKSTVFAEAPDADNAAVREIYEV